MNPREKYDLLWELSQSAMKLGRETELLASKPTIEDQKRAFTRWRKAMAKAHERLEVSTLEADDCRNCGRRNATIPLYSGYNESDLDYNKVCSDTCLQEMGEAYEEAHSGW